MIHSKNYRTPKTLKRPSNKSHTAPCTFLTPLDYNEIERSSTRTQNQDAEHPARCRNVQISRSLLRDINSLLPKKISLLRLLNFPVNFEGCRPKKKESPLYMGRFVYMDVN